MANENLSENTDFLTEDCSLDPHWILIGSSMALRATRTLL